jgi:hypothetical protein
MLRSTPMRALRVTYAFISRAFETDAIFCRDTFFSKALPESELQRCARSLIAAHRAWHARTR